jgi:hypothetical protein
MTPTAAKRPLQLNDQGQLRHFLSLDGLSRELLTEILDTADSFLEVGARAVKKVPLLRGKTVCNVFFENSTRTRTTFELAAQRLSADVISLNVSTSSTSKGETLFDTLRNLEAIAADQGRDQAEGAERGELQHVAGHLDHHLAGFADQLAHAGDLLAQLDDGETDQAESFRHVAGDQRLQRDIGIGERQHAERVAVVQVALDDPDTGQRPEQGLDTNGINQGHARF